MFASISSRSPCPQHFVVLFLQGTARIVSLPPQKKAISGVIKENNLLRMLKGAGYFAKIQEVGIVYIKDVKTPFWNTFFPSSIIYI